MGCTSSKQPLCRNCHAPCSPMRRSYSMHVHHPPQRDGDTYHVVALTSTSLGYLQLDPSDSNHVKNQEPLQIRQEHVRQNATEKKIKDFAVGVTEANSWSKMIDEKIPKFVPKTPIGTPPGEPETINAWELMEGLDDTTPLRPPSATNHLRSFSFHVNPNSITSSLDEPLSISQEKGREAKTSLKSLWQQIAENGAHDSNSNSKSNIFSNVTSIASDFDPEVISSFRKSLEFLPPANPFHLNPLVNNKEPSSDGNGDGPLNLTYEKKPFENVNVSDGKNNIVRRGKEKLVLYFTSLRGVRKTYEDCCHVRVILKGTGVRVDERDVSMHLGFKEELKELLGNGFSGGLPKVFVGKKYIGGAEEIRRLHEEGRLEKVLQGCETAADGGCRRGGGGCEACGDIRFLPCERCSGSCKIYHEVDGDDEEEESDHGFQRCPDCNENGLIRCPLCCD